MELGGRVMGAAENGGFEAGRHLVGRNMKRVAHASQTEALVDVWVKDLNEKWWCASHEPDQSLRQSCADEGA